MKVHVPGSLPLGLLICTTSGLTIVPPRPVGAAPQGPDQTRLWYPSAEDALASPVATRRITPGRYRTLSLNHTELLNLLARAPMERTNEDRQPEVTMEVPWPDGSVRRFRIEESPMMEPELAAQFPEIKTYAGQGVDDRTATLRFDWTPSGFHAMVLSAEGTVFIDPYSPPDTRNYITYYTRDYTRVGAQRSRCGVTGEEVAGLTEGSPLTPLQPPHGATRRIYRLAVAATGEYTAFHGGTVAGAMNAIVTTVNRVNLIYQRDLALRLDLVANNSSIIHTDASTDGYTNGDSSAMQCENARKLDAVIGASNYDIGHVLGTGGISNATVGVVCNPTNVCGSPSGSVKANGVSLSTFPEADGYDVNVVAHEIGHQFGADHTFNGTTGACLNTRWADTAFEPGSGSTILSYAGRCGSENLSPFLLADPYFHAGSLDQMIAFITNPSTGGSCGAPSATGNSPPAVSAGPDYTIPRSTPFTLTAVGSDPSGEYLTYTWEEMDVGPFAPPNTDADGGLRPIFRSFLPTPSPSRTFPKLSDILNNTTTFGESLPTQTRTMKFRLTARDNRLGAGGTASDDMFLNVRADSGPFVVTQPNSAVTWPGGSSQTVTWNVANTTAAPVSCANVRISLSADGGNSFPILLAASTPNDGSEVITVPNYATTSARIKIEAVGNVFFDVSNANFTINTSGSSLSLDDITVIEGTTAVFTVRLLPTTAATVTVSYATGDDTATAGSDYVSTSGNLTFLPGEATKTVTVVVNGDTPSEPAETFFVNLSGAMNATISDSQGVATITNDGCTIVSLGVLDGTFEAGNPWPAWTVQTSTNFGTPLCDLSCPTNGGSIGPFAGSNWAWFGGVVGAAETATLGQTITLQQSISLTLRFRMRIAQYTVGAHNLVISVDGTPVTTFTDVVFESQYSLRQADLSAFADGGSHALLFTYNGPAVAPPYTSSFLLDNIELLACPPPGMVNNCLSDGTFEAGNPWPAWTVQSSSNFGTPICDTTTCGTSGGYTPPFGGNNWVWFGGASTPETSTVGQTVTLPLSSHPTLRFQMMVPTISSSGSDTLAVSVDGTTVQTFVDEQEAGVSYSLRQVDLTPFADGGSHALLFRYQGPSGELSTFLVDNVELLCLPRPSLSISDVTVAEGDTPGTTAAQFVMTLSAPSAHTVTAAYVTANATATASDYVSASGTVTFAPGTSTQFLEVSVVGDTLDETAETFFVNLSSATNATISDAQGVATISDDDLPPSLSIDNCEVNENSSARFFVTLSDASGQLAASGQQVTVGYVTVDGTATTAGLDYIATSGTLTFAPGDTILSVFVPVNGDTVDEPDEVFFMNLGSAVNATIAIDQGVGTIVNQPDLIFRDGFESASP